MWNVMSRNRIANFATIPCGMIQANSFDLRATKKGIKVLRESIRANGLLTPISLRQVGGRYVVVDGMRRLVAWREEYPDQPIPAILLNYPTEMVDEKEGQLRKMEMVKRDAYTANTIRLKLPKKKVEEYVLELHEKGMGYKAIADCIGYKKSGVQKIISRLESRNQEPVYVANTSKKKTVNKIKRIRTSLCNLFNDLEYATDGDKELFQRIDNLLREHEDAYSEELEKEKYLYKNQDNKGAD